MTSGDDPRPRSTAGRRIERPYRLLLLVAAPALVLLLFRLNAPSTPDAAELTLRAAEWSATFKSLMLEAQGIAAATLDPSAARPRSVLDARLEGRGMIDRDGRYVSWEGTPAEPPTDFLEPDSPEWRVRVEPVRTRLIVRAGPDPEGHFALATFVLRSSVDGQRFESLIPARLRDGIQARLAFRDMNSTESPQDFPESVVGTRPAALSAAEACAVLETPDGRPLGAAVLEPLDSELRARRFAAAGRATALLVLLALAGLLFGWRGLCRTGPGFATATAALCVARLALARLDVPATLFTRELGGASLFGSASAYGLIASPVDLLLTGVAVYLLAVATRVYCRELGRRHAGRAALIVAAAALALSVIGVALCQPLARDSRMPLLDRQALFEGDARALLLIGFVLFLLSAAELWGLTWFLTRRPGAATRPGRLPVAVALLVLCAISGAAIQRLDQELAIERLRSEFAPLVLEQSPRRELALTEAVRHVYDAYREPDQAAHAVDGPAEDLAYRFWVDSALFTTGYKSSLDFFNASGARISHFAFDLPLFDEPLAPPLDDDGRLVTREEEFQPVPAFEQEIFHAEVAVYRHGVFLGTVVGHVLDEPDNLPFLPQSRPYLEALGAGRRNPDHAGSVDSWEDPQYVLYDPFGTLRQSTLVRPPPVTEALRQAGETREVVRVASGEDRYVGLALADHGRLHLLLVPARGVFEQAAAAVRLALLGLVVLALLGLVPALLRQDGMAPWKLKLRQSFYSKLLTALLLASVLPLFGLGLIMRGYVQRRGDAALNDSATQYAAAAQRVLEDYVAVEGADDVRSILDDDILHWLRRVVGQEIHVFGNGVLQASSKRELFSAGLSPQRIDGEVHRQIVDEGRPSIVKLTPLGAGTVPVAYAPVRNSDPHLELVVAVPVVLEQRQISRAIDRLVQVAQLAMVLLVGALAILAAFLARTVARPVRELVDAAGQIAAGDYDARLLPSSRDEIGELVLGFNSMAAALSHQRADLERRREYMERLLEHATTGVISTDGAGRIVTLNPAARELLTAAAPALEPGADLGQALSTSPLLRPLARALAVTAREHNEPQDVDLERDHNPRRFRFVRIPLPEPGGDSGTLILLDDVTELMRSNQLAAWAEMARAIAHEIKNPLTPIQLSTEHLRRLLIDRRVLPSPEIEACLDTVIKQVRSLHEIAGEFSTYAKLPDLAPEAADPVALMRSVIGPYRAAHPPGVTFRLDFVEAGTIKVDRRVLSRALVNLIENALHAMPDGGTLTVGVRPLPDSDEVELSVTDTGTGLDAEVKRRLFEPYFSTRSSGTGLGLAIVQRAVEAHRGRISVESEPGQGAAFRIVLPSASRAS